MKVQSRIDHTFLYKQPIKVLKIYKKKNKLNWSKNKTCKKNQLKKIKKTKEWLSL